MTKPCDDIVERLSGTAISDAFNDGWITSGVFAERLIEDRHDARDEILRLRAEIESLRRPSAWREIAEAPRDGTVVLVNCKHDGVVPAKWEDGWGVESAWRHDPGGWPQDPTHFQPLPTPPGGGEEEKGVLAEDGETAGARRGEGGVK